MEYKAGKDTIVYHPELSTFCEGVEFGERCKVHSHVWIGRNVKTGDDVKIEAFAFIPEGIKIGNKVFVGPGVIFTNDKYPPSEGKYWMETVIENGVVIGAGAVILPGVRIGTKATVGAGAVVTRDVAPDTIVTGNPARLFLRKKKAIGQE